MVARRRALVAVFTRLAFFGNAGGVSGMSVPLARDTRNRGTNRGAAAKKQSGIARPGGTGGSPGTTSSGSPAPTISAATSAPQEPQSSSEPPRASSSSARPRTHTRTPINRKGYSYTTRPQPHPKNKFNVPQPRPPVIPSLGSAGHPVACTKLGCKFAHKPRGCKDGANCDRCHYCPWNPNAVTKTSCGKDVAAAGGATSLGGPREADEHEQEFPAGWANGSPAGMQTRQPVDGDEEVDVDRLARISTCDEKHIEQVETHSRSHSPDPFEDAAPTTRFLEDLQTGLRGYTRALKQRRERGLMLRDRPPAPPHGLQEHVGDEDDHLQEPFEKNIPSTPDSFEEEQVLGENGMAYIPGVDVEAVGSALAGLRVSDDAVEMEEDNHAEGAAAAEQGTASTFRRRKVIRRGGMGKRQRRDRTTATR